MARGVSEFDSTVTCRCGHGSTAHEHYRRGTDCGLCECVRFRSTQASLLARFLERRGIRREPAPRPPGVAGPAVQPAPAPEPARTDVHTDAHADVHADVHARNRPLAS